MKNLATKNTCKKKCDHKTLNGLMNLKRPIMSFNEKFIFLITNKIIEFSLILQILDIKFY